jgi:hypothetical protein
MLRIKNAYLLEINLATVSAGQRYQLPDDSKLRGQKIKAIEAVNTAQLSVSPSQKNVVSLAATQRLLLTIATKTRAGNEESVYRMPYYSLIGAFNGGIIKEFDNIEINLSKSYLTLTNADTLTAGESACIIFYF